LQAALNAIYHNDPKAKAQFNNWLLCLRGMVELTSGIAPVEMQFSAMEALWSRGFSDAKRIDGLFKKDFKNALTGSIAYDHADTIWKNSGAKEPIAHLSQAKFKPVNPDGSLVNCVPPPHLSPLGPVAYLHELLQVVAKSTCEHPLPVRAAPNVATILADRRGPLSQLLATEANLEVPIPMIDIVNESLEYMAANNEYHGAVYNTSKDQVGGHALTSKASPTPDAHLHDPATLLEALPEHSTPATPAAKQDAYNKLKKDFSAWNLPYSQPLDVSRTYLKQLGTDRFAAMRRFRKDITEFVLDPAKETAEFQKHLWRYPVRIETALEYLGITPEEYDMLFQQPISNAARPQNNKLLLYQLYGFPQQKEANGQVWTKTIVKVSEFLERTCLTYCEFLELWKSGFVKFDRQGSKDGFSDCEPCCLDRYLIEFNNPSNPVQALKRLIVFIRLWRKLQIVPRAGYSFTELRAICDVLKLFKGTNVNPDFIR
jgi:hypothetical protein